MEIALIIFEGILSFSQTPCFMKATFYILIFLYLVIISLTVTAH
jgi:hypothetical protein